MMVSIKNWQKESYCSTCNDVLSSMSQSVACWMVWFEIIHLVIILKKGSFVEYQPSWKPGCVCVLIWMRCNHLK